MLYRSHWSLSSIYIASISFISAFVWIPTARALNWPVKILTLRLVMHWVEVTHCYIPSWSPVVSHLHVLLRRWESSFLWMQLFRYVMNWHSSFKRKPQEIFVFIIAQLLKVFVRLLQVEVYNPWKSIWALPTEGILEMKSSNCWLLIKVLFIERMRACIVLAMYNVPSIVPFRRLVFLFSCKSLNSVAMGVIILRPRCC